MSKNTVRPYEMSVWTLRDRYLATLKVPGVENKGHIQEPKMTLNIDGTQELSFKVPMYYFKNNEFIENPYWYDVKNGLLLMGMRKIKVIFNKGNLEEEVFEFLVTNVEEKHEDDGTLFCEVECSGMYFQELGKKGYNISLSEEDYYDDYDKYLNGELDTMPVNNINYWCDKVFKNSDWTYSIQMDWSNYDGILYRRVYDPRNEVYYGIELVLTTPNDINGIIGSANVGRFRVGDDGVGGMTYGPIVGLARVDFSELIDPEQIDISTYFENYASGEFVLYQDLLPAEQKAVNSVRKRNSYFRLNTKVYEDDYVSSWSVDEQNNILIPDSYERFKEKYRLINESNSNIYNLTQNIAEKFGVYCKYKYHYDDNYHIIGKEVIFYNTFSNEIDSFVDLTYGFNASSITRKMDSNDLCSKLIVNSVEDDTSALGTLSIINTAANRSGENYILNFEYLYDTGEIDEDQYNEIAIFETDMRNYNNDLAPLSKNIAKLSNELVELEASLTITNESIASAADQRETALASLKALTVAEKAEQGNTRTTTRTVQNDEDIPYINITEKGVTQVQVYSRNSTNTPITNFTVKKENGFIVKISTTDFTETMYSVTITSFPQSYYENIANIFEEKENAEKAKKENLSSEIETKNSQLENDTNLYETILQNKQKRITEFEKLMGPALREGSWQPEDYEDYGEFHDVDISITNRKTNPTNNEVEFIWDNESFDGEQLNYYELGVLLTKNYYPYINLTNILSTIRPFIEEGLQFTYSETINGKIQNRYFTLGSTMQLSFLNNNNTIIPVFILTGTENEEFTITQGKICNLEGNLIADNVSVISNTNSLLCVFPRIKIDNLALKSSDDQLHITHGETVLRKYYDYATLMRNDTYYITLNAKQVIKYWNDALNIQYALSNAELNIYLDAKEVSKNNAIPQVSYEIELMALRKDFIKSAYKQLNHLVHINDFSLKFENVMGYISNLELDLDKPWEDTVEIKNYKTKFEDLFTKIVATTEQMKANASIYDKAASAFNSAGDLRSDILQASINSSINLSMALKKGNLTISEENGILASSEDGVVMMTGGGIFCASDRNSDGEWDWHTGLLPSGINASLITTGQLDTNLIRIFAGDNLRLQMNGNGLFAYKNDTQSQYVVHNENGLFLKDGNINKVEISWDGLIIRNNNNINVFYADNDGNLTITGTIHATSGNIGNWILGSNDRTSWLYNEYLENGQTRYSGLQTGSDTGSSISIAIASPSNETWEGAPFKVKQDGSMYATKGEIAGWTIEPNYLHSGDGVSYVALNSNPTSEYAIWAGAVNPNNATFSVKKNGAISIQGVGNKLLTIEEGAITALRVSAENIVEQYVGKNNIHLSTNALSGDEADDTCYDTIAELNEYIEDNISNRYLINDIVIMLHDTSASAFYSGVIRIENVYGPGKIIIKSNNTNNKKWICAIECENCHAAIELNALNIWAQSATGISANFINCSNVQCIRCSFYSRNTSLTENASRAVVFNNSNAILYNCVTYAGYYSIDIINNSHVFFDDKITCWGSDPTYTTNKTVNWIRVSGSIAHVAKFVVGNGDLTVGDKVVEKGGILEIGTDSGGGSSSQSYTVQGAKAGGNIGSIKNGTQNASFKVYSATIPQNAKITKITLTVNRVSGFGVGAALKFHYTNWNSTIDKNSSISLSGGQTKTIEITSDTLTALKNGNFIDNSDKVISSDGLIFLFKLKQATENGYADYGSRNYSYGYMKLQNCYITVTYTL